MSQLPSNGTERVDAAEKTISASPQVIFEALTTRSAVAEWLPPLGSSGEILEFDPRPGGPFKMILTFANKRADGKTTGNTDTINAHFAKIKTNELVEQAIEFASDDPAYEGTMTMRWMLHPAGAGGTLVRVEARDVPEGIDPKEHANGLKSSLDNLEEYLLAAR